MRGIISNNAAKLLACIAVILMAAFLIVPGLSIDSYADNSYSYRVEFNGQNADYGYMAPVEYSNSIQQTLPANQYIKNGYFFNGWNTEADGSGTAFADQQSVIDIAAPNETLTLYAQWISLSNTESINSGGEMIVAAKAGQRVIIPNLPANTSYTVEEIGIPKGWANTDQYSTSGKISSNVTSSSGVENTYSAAGKATIMAHKSLSGTALHAGMFSFQLRDSEGTLIATETNGSVDNEQNTYDENGVESANPWYNTAPVMFSNIPVTTAGTYVFTIDEVASDPEHFVYDTHTEAVTVTATDNGDGTLNTVTEYDTDGPLFQNSVVEVSGGNLIITKETVGATSASANQEFEFTVNIYDVDGKLNRNTYDAAIVSTSATQEFTFTPGDTVCIRGGEQAVIYELPVGLTYTVTESEQDGWELASSSGASGVLSTSDTTASFRNIYTTLGSAEIRASKTFIGGSITTEHFQFELRSSTGELISTAYANPDGTVVFTPIDYTSADDGRTFYYYISEVQGEDGILYDESTKEVAVSVQDNGQGSLVATITYDPNGMNFVNSAAVDLIIGKEVRGNLANREKYFTYTLRLFNSDDTPYTETVAIPDGATDWAQVSDGVYTFKLKHGNTATINLFSGMKYNVTEAPEEYFCRVTVKEGSTTIRNEEEAPTAQGTLRAENGNTSVSYTNYLVSVIPTGVDDYTTIGIDLAVLGIVAAAIVLIIRSRKNKKQKYSAAH